MMNVSLLAGSENSHVFLTRRDAEALLLTLNRALNTWDPAERPAGILDLADNLEQMIAGAKL